MKTIVITPAFCKSIMLEQSLANYYEYQTENYEHWILLNHYPINKEKNNDEIRKIAEKFKCKLFDNQYDRGLHKGVNNFYVQNPQPEGTFQIGYDPDSAIEQLSHGFDKALSETLRIGIKDHNLAILALWGIGVELKKKQLLNRTIINGNAVMIHPDIEMFSVTACDLDFINTIGGFSEPNEYYGGIEISLYQSFQKYNRKLGYLTEFKEKYFAYPAECVDPEYIQWKHDHVNGFIGSFESWLKINKPELL
jgi:hypothetical protein